MEMDGVKIVTVDRIEEELSEKKKEKLEEADVLLIDIDQKAAEIAKKSAANYVIPVGYSGSEDKNLKEFLDAFDKEGLESLEELKVERESLPEGMEVVLLKTK